MGTRLVAHPVGAGSQNGPASSAATLQPARARRCPAPKPPRRRRSRRYHVDLVGSSSNRRISLRTRVGPGAVVGQAVQADSFSVRGDRAGQDPCISVISHRVLRPRVVADSKGSSCPPPVLVAARVGGPGIPSPHRHTGASKGRAGVPGPQAPHPAVKACHLPLSGPPGSSPPGPCAGTSAPVPQRVRVLSRYPSVIPPGLAVLGHVRVTPAVVLPVRQSSRFDHLESPPRGTPNGCSSCRGAGQAARSGRPLGVGGRTGWQRGPVLAMTSFGRHRSQCPVWLSHVEAGTARCAARSLLSRSIATTASSPMPPPSLPAGGRAAAGRHLQVVARVWTKPPGFCEDAAGVQYTPCRPCATIAAEATAARS